jgi:uncharacterized phage protein (TIGR01671 family)
MNREIKFRAWDIATKKMYKVDELKNLWEYLGSGGLNYPIAIIQKTRGDDYEINIAKEGNALLQYTGLKDKNGKEIYEGDILKCEEGNDEIIEFKNGAFICRYRTTNLYYLWLNQYIEVIGNIFENPELLKT